MFTWTRFVSIAGAAGLIVLLTVIALSGEGSDDALTGTIEIDGSSTVFPIAEAIAEEFSIRHRNVQVNVGVSGTGGGFKRFAVGDTDISDASRPIKPAEAELAAQNGIGFIEMRVGTDGLSVVVNPSNGFVTCLTIDELKDIWQPTPEGEEPVTSWDQVRAEFPGGRMRLYGPDTDSGTFDYFTEEIVGEVQASRDDYTASANDNVLVQGISGDQYSLGYFGFAYYQENADKVKAVEVDGGAGCVAPTIENIESGDYEPLSRPLFIYVNVESVAKPQVTEFLRFFMTHAETLVTEVGYVPAHPDEYAENLTKAGI